MPPSAWRSTRESCPDRRSSLIAQASPCPRYFKSQISNLKSEISNHGWSAGRLIFRRWMHLPKIWIRLRKRHARLDGSAIPRAQKNDAAILLLLRQLVGEQ